VDEWDVAKNLFQVHGHRSPGQTFSWYIGFGIVVIDKPIGLISA
jgi:hypothetical protein